MIGCIDLKNSFHMINGWAGYLVVTGYSARLVVYGLG